jgi:hypothetical protein
MDDPDAPSGTFVHWVLYNMDPKINGIKENSVPQSTLQGKTSTGKTGYVGACPPLGTHRYFFRLYALGKVLSLGANADKQTLEEAMKENILEEAEIIGLYSKK